MLFQADAAAAATVPPAEDAIIPGSKRKRKEAKEASEGHATGSTAPRCAFRAWKGCTLHRVKRSQGLKILPSLWLSGEVR